jgi:hypothetical protein
MPSRVGSELPGFAFAANLWLAEVLRQARGIQGNGDQSEEMAMAAQIDAGPGEGKSSFAEDLNQLITLEITKGTDPQDIVDELTREANLVFGHYNLEFEIAAHCCERATPRRRSRYPRGASVDTLEASSSTGSGRGPCFRECLHASG